MTLARSELFDCCKATTYAYAHECMTSMQLVAQAASYQLIIRIKRERERDALQQVSAPFPFEATTA